MLSRLGTFFRPPIPPSPTEFVLKELKRARLADYSHLILTLPEKHYPEIAKAIKIKSYIVSKQEFDLMLKYVGTKEFNHIVSIMEKLSSVPPWFEVQDTIEGWWAARTNQLEKNIDKLVTYIEFAPAIDRDLPFGAKQLQVNYIFDLQQKKQEELNLKTFQRARQPNHSAEMLYDDVAREITRFVKHS